MYRCLDAAIKAKCDLAVYKNFKADRIFGAVSEAITYHDCGKYPNYESCQFPLKKVISVFKTVFDSKFKSNKDLNLSVIHPEWIC